MKLKLAEALLRRKELQQKVDQLARLKDDQLFALVIDQKPITDNVMEVRAAVPRVSMEQVTADYDWHAKQLRRVDAAIQQANWMTEIDVDAEVVEDYVEDPRWKETELPVRAGRVDGR
jgi:hypothetical protein